MKRSTTMPRLNLTVTGGRYSVSVTGKTGLIDLHIMSHKNNTVTVWGGRDFKVDWSKETFDKFVTMINGVTFS